MTKNILNDRNDDHHMTLHELNPPVGLRLIEKEKEKKRAVEKKGKHNK